MITTRNLIYHLCPFDNNDTWLKNLAQLRRRWHLFNGQRIISVATGGGMMPLERIKPFLPDPAIEWLTFPNCKTMRESTSFYPMMERLSDSPDEVTFYAHAKGVTRGACDVRVRDWRNQMYAHLLDRSEECMTKLLAYPCVGAYRMFHHKAIPRAPHLTNDQRNCRWHYAGTFFWFRNKDVFNHVDWKNVQMTGWAVEFYLPQLFSHAQAFCIYRDNPPHVYNHDHDSCPDEPDWPSVFMEKQNAPVGG